MKALRIKDDQEVSTHSRLKAAGSACAVLADTGALPTPPRLTAAGPPPADDPLGLDVSTHSRLKAAGS